MLEMLLFIVIMIISTFFGALGSLKFKRAANNSQSLFFLIKNVDFYIGGILFSIAFGTYLLILNKGDLSSLFPLTSITYVWTCTLSVKYLKEKMNFMKWLGIFFIMLGVFLVAL